MGTLDQYSGNAGSALSGLGSGANIYSGLKSGKPTGYIGATVGAGKLAGKLGAFGDSTKGVNAGLGDVGSALGIYNGIKSGGVGGDAQAAISAGQLGLNTGIQSGLLSASAAAPYLQGLNYAAIPLNLYNEINNWQSGATGSDALAGAGTGASIGTAILPGIGTGIGALLGGAAGALSSVFGNGKVAPENANWVGYTGAQNQVAQAGQAQGANADQIQSAQNNLASQVSNPYGALAGYFDLRDNQVKGNNPLYSQYGRKGEQQFTNDLVGQINSAQKAGTIGANDSASDIYNKVVTPWEDSWGKGTSTDANAGAMQGLITQMISQYEGGNASQDWLGRSGDQAFANLQGPTASVAPGGTTSANLNDLNSIAAAHDQQRQSLGLAPAATQVQNQTAAPAVTPQVGIGNTSPAGNLLSGAIGQATQQIQPTTGNQMARPVMKKGGALSRYKHKVSSFRTGGKTNYDEGGDVDYGDDFSSQPTFNPGSTIDFNSLYDGGSGNSNDNFTSQLNDIQNQLTQDQFTNSQLGTYIDSLGADKSSAPSGLSKLLGNFSGAGGLSGLLKAYTPLVGILGSAIASKNNKTPTTAPGMPTSAVTSMPTPHFNRTQVASPTNAPGGAPMTQQDWYTYGSRPEAQFFQNNGIPLTQSVTGQAKGGRTSSQGAIGQMQQPQGGEFDSSQQSYVGDGEEMPGDGQSDDVQAKLSKGEFVMDGHTVSMLGNGSNSAGAQKLETLRQNLRKHAAKSNSKGKQFMKAKEPEQYMGKSKVKGKGKPVAFGVQ